jgi:hypothetical protein
VGAVDATAGITFEDFVSPGTEPADASPEPASVEEPASALSSGPEIERRDAFVPVSSDSAEPFFSRLWKGMLGTGFYALLFAFGAAAVGVVLIIILPLVIGGISLKTQHSLPETRPIDPVKAAEEARHEREEFEQALAKVPANVPERERTSEAARILQKERWKKVEDLMDTLESGRLPVASPPPARQPSATPAPATAGT